ncbi:MAG: thiamine pyrophosphate-binding protein [Streptosporangiales bacterium]|nr:thiamine pyrophosphate-binding protein [Streptosporangiales bacterium]
MSEQLTGGEVVVETLRREGVDVVFGLIGSATMELFDALHGAADIRFVGVRDERTGTHMADAYARTTGRPGVMIAGQNGPGVTNLVTGLAQAYRAYSPVLTLGGAVARPQVDRESFQELDQQALLTPVTKRTFSVGLPENLARTMHAAFRTALAPRTGPVHVNLPRDVLAAPMDRPALPDPASYRPAARPYGDPACMPAAAELLANAQRPLAVAGAGIKWGGRYAEALQLAETLGCPIAAAAGHGDAVPTDHPLAAGQVGPRGNVVASRLMREADVIVALGTRLGFNSTFFSTEHINPDAAIVHVELEPTAMGREFPFEVGIVGDAAAVAGQLTEALGAHRPSAAVQAWTTQFQADRAALLQERDAAAMTDRNPLQPAQVFGALRRVLPRDAIVTLDAGTLCLQATDVLPYHTPPALLTPLDFGLVGFSFAAGLGAKLAAPGRPVVSLMGDGGFGMTTSELSTAVAEGIATTVLVLNNGVWGAEKAYQRDFFGGRYLGADLHNPPFDKLAELYGARGLAVSNAADLDDVLKEAVAGDRCCVVDIAVDPDALYSFRRDSFAHRAGGSGR